MNSDLRAAAIRRNIADDIRVRNAAWEMLAALKAALVEVRNPGTHARNGNDIEAVILGAIANADGRPE